MKIVNKKRFIKAIISIVAMIAIIVAINIFANNLIVNGLDELFTSNLKEAFEETTEADKLFINTFRWISILLSITVCYSNLDYQAEMAECEKQEKILLSRVGM